MISLKKMTVEDLPHALVRQIAREAIEQYQELQREATVNLEDSMRWSAVMAARYSDNDETANAAFCYDSDSAATDRWR